MLNLRSVDSLDRLWIGPLNSGLKLLENLPGRSSRDCIDPVEFVFFSLLFWQSGCWNDLSLDPPLWHIPTCVWPWRTVHTRQHSSVLLSLLKHKHIPYHLEQTFAFILLCKFKYRNLFLAKTKIEFNWWILFKEIELLSIQTCCGRFILGLDAQTPKLSKAK